MNAVVAEPVGGPQNLKYVEVPQPEPGEGEVLVKLAAIGVNFIDVYYRNGLYPAPETPVRLGNEGAGTVVALGKGATLGVGQRVAYAMSRGSYSEYAAVPEKALVALSRQDQLSRCRSDHVAGDDGALPNPLNLSAKGRTDLSGSCGRGRRRVADSASGKDRGRHCNWDMFDRRESQARPSEWGRPRDSLHRTGFCRSRKGHHERRGCGSCLRFGRENDVRQESGLPEAARSNGDVRAIERADR